MRARVSTCVHVCLCKGMCESNIAMKLAQAQSLHETAGAVCEGKRIASAGSLFPGDAPRM